jgi:2-C-methyl-D-erythritol 4-phosphate cytidylyltransferase
MIFGGILAGGIGTRMNIVNMPKQFLMLGEKPIIIHTLEKFLLCNRFDIIYIGVHRDWVTYCNELVEKYIDNCEKIKIIEGGKDRNDTIMNIVRDIEQNYGESDEHIIVTHDSVRPFVSLKIIEENIDSAIKYAACDTVIKATDTIVVSDDGKIISNIPDRSKMYQGQTPQSFKVNLLKKLYTELTNEEKEILTDACKICVIRNVPVHLVEGETLNIKITTMSDLTIANAIMKGENNL